MTAGGSKRIFRIRGLLGVVALACAGAAPRLAQAAQPIDVVTTGCSTLDRREIERLLSVELGSVSRQWQESVASEPLHIELSCLEERGRSSRVAVTISDRLTQKRLTREVEIDPTAPDRDRTAALLVSELFLGSWTELLRSVVAPPPPPPPPAPAPPPAERPPRPEPPRSIRGAVDLLAGARMRALDHPIASGDLSLRLETIAARHARVFVLGGYERGASGRSDGTVDFSLASAGLGVGWRSSRIGRLVLDVAASGSAAYVDLSGSAHAGAVGSSISGAVAELALQGGPSLVLGPARIGLELTAGWTVSPVTGHVIGGSVATTSAANATSDVSLGGIWLGASLVFATAEAGL